MYKIFNHQNRVDAVGVIDLLCYLLHNVYVLIGIFPIADQRYAFMYFVSQIVPMCVSVCVL